ncbi:MAG: helix-turn-helix transcriptional regulator [Dehalococcoidia bacterium]|nr:helix-turn-helix transcriptional regulator [Dehalococcoidia bacterium]
MDDTDVYGNRVVWTARQRQVLDLIAAGRTNGEIAELLAVSLGGAKWHVSEVLGKLGVASREEAAAIWKERSAIRSRLGRLARGLVPTALAARIGLAAAPAIAGGALLVGVGSWPFHGLPGFEQDGPDPGFDSQPATVTIAEITENGVTFRLTGSVRDDGTWLCVQSGERWPTCAGPGREQGLFGWAPGRPAFFWGTLPPEATEAVATLHTSGPTSLTIHDAPAELPGGMQFYVGAAGHEQDIARVDLLDASGAVVASHSLYPAP